MLVAMGITAFLCTLLGVYPKVLYNLLPYPVHYEPYTAGHVVSMSQLLLFTFVAFWMLRQKLHGERTVTLDTDWFFRMAGKRVIWFCEEPLMAFANFIDRNAMSMVGFFVWFSRNPVVALGIKKEEMKLIGKKLFASPERVEEYRRGLEEERKRYPGELPRLTLGASVFLILLFLSLYLTLYLLTVF
jgi:multicomponent Na+:H+ antiporter subunit D